MVDFQKPTNFATPFMANALHLGDAALNASGDESIFPASTLSARSDCDSSSEMTSLLLTARSSSPTNLFEEDGFGLSVNHTGVGGIVDLDKLTKYDTTANHSTNNSFSPKTLGMSMNHQPTNYFSGQSSTVFLPIATESVHSPRSRTPSPGISKMLLSLSNHPSERPCTPNASTLYRNTKTHCNPSELGQQTYDECMFYTKWANSFLQHSQDQFLITDLARDLGDGLTLLSLVEMLVGEYPPQIHIKPALDVQKMENVQTCLDFLEYYDVSVNSIAAEDIVKGNLKVVLALCHCLYRHFASNPATNRRVCHLTGKDDLVLIRWVSRMTGKHVTDFQSFQDGTVLCLLLNKILEDAVPNLVLEFGSPSEKVNLALKVSSEHLSIVTSLQEEDVTQLRSREKFLEYLKSLYLLHTRKTKSTHDALEQSNFRRDIKKLQLREQRLKPRHGSQLTYLGELSPNKSCFARERLEFSLANPSEYYMSNGRQSNNTGHELKQVPSGPRGSTSKFTAHNGNFNNKKQQLNELEEELRLLMVECNDDSYDDKHSWTDKPGHTQLSFQGDSSPIYREPNMQGRQTNPRQELRNVYRGNLGKKTRDTVGNVDVVASSRHNPFETDCGSNKRPFGGCFLGDPPGNLGKETHDAVRNSGVISSTSYGTSERDSDNGKLFGGCYLSESHGGFDYSGRRDLEHSLGENSRFKDYPVQSSILKETRTFIPQTSSQTMVNAKTDTENGHALFPKSSMKTHGISNLFDVDFSDLDARMTRDQENSAVKRMMRAGNRSKLDSRSRFGAELPSSRGTVNVNGETSKAVPSSATKLDKGERLGRLRNGLDVELSASPGAGNVNGETSKVMLSSATKLEKRERLERLRHGLDVELSASPGAGNRNNKMAKSLMSSISEQDQRERLGMVGDWSRRELVTDIFASLGQTNGNGQMKNALSSSSTKQDKGEEFPLTLRSLPSSKPVCKDERSSLSRETGTFSRESNKPVRELQRSLSKEKRHREQVLAKKSARNVQPSSKKTQVNDLTALIRSSARNAGASCSEED